jgi:hypothetical protein
MPACNLTTVTTEDDTDDDANVSVEMRLSYTARNYLYLRNLHTITKHKLNTS